MPAPAKFLQHPQSTNANTSRLTESFAGLIRTLMIQFDPYRPELYYMRGPGPRWHAKNDPAAAALDNIRGSRTRMNFAGWLGSRLRYPEETLAVLALFTGLDRPRRKSNHQFAEAKLRNWR
ncbi:MAG TPA: hypothetical protein VGL34_23735 [Steroidobacteraceae bacterium]|jgi:hypothetical protein